MLPSQSLLQAFSRLEDPRCRRGVRHPFAGMVVLMLLGMLARIREMEVLVRWATVHWDQLREALGFDRDQPPCARPSAARWPNAASQSFRLPGTHGCEPALRKRRLAGWSPWMARPPNKDATITAVRCTCCTSLCMTCKQSLANGRPERRRPTNQWFCGDTWKNCSPPTRCCGCLPATRCMRNVLWWSCCALRAAIICCKLKPIREIPWTRYRTVFPSSRRVRPLRKPPIKGGSRRNAPPVGRSGQRGLHS